MSKHSLSIESFARRVRPLLGQLYIRALLVTDNAGKAEDALQEGLVEVYRSASKYPDKRSLRDALRKAVNRKAYRLLIGGNTGGDWREDKAVSFVEDAYLSALYSRYCMEDDAVRRYFLLRFGCGIEKAQAAETAGLTNDEAKERYARFRMMAGGARDEAFERKLIRMCRAILDDAASLPGMDAVLRSFEKEAAENRVEKGRHGSVLFYGLCFIGVLLCMILFWLAVILIDPGQNNISLHSVQMNVVDTLHWLW